MLDRTLILFILLAFWPLIEAKRSRERKVFATQLENEQKDSERTGRLFSLFNIVQFKNDVCTSQMRRSNVPVGAVSSNRMGTCMTSTECSGKGGTASGNCAAGKGFGVCCLFILSATGAVVTQNCTYLTNPGFPSTFSPATTVSYTLNKCSNEVCSLRLDFETFQTQANTDTSGLNPGLCPDMLTIKSSSQPTYPVICGLNTGQHVYIDVGMSTGNNAMLTFSFATNLATTPSRMWDIKVTQVLCGTSNPPAGCFQYFTGTSGIIKTFNFDDASGTTTQLRNEQYTACIRQSCGFCCVQYLPCANQANAFSIHPFVNNPTINIGSVDSQCTNDFIQITGASASCLSTNANQVSRICGTFFTPLTTTPIKGAVPPPTPICDCSEPFEVTIHTDTTVVTFNGNQQTRVARGVCLQYQQLPCGTTA